MDYLKNYCIYENQRKFYKYHTLTIIVKLLGEVLCLVIKGFFSRKKQAFDEDDMFESVDEYVELDTHSNSELDQKVIVRTFVIEDFSDVKEILDVLRESYTIALINIKPIKDKDLIELKRSINKLKKTCEAINGDIAGFGEDYIVVTPGFAQIYRGSNELDSDDI